MENNEYLDFEEAVQFLKTTPSTLYKWLQAGKVPGHKLGRQWRFLKDELELHVSGRAPKIQLQKEALQLAELLNSRAKTKQEEDVETGLDQLSEKLIWDAFDHGSRLIHVYPSRGKYEISYRTREGLEKLTEIQEELFVQFDQALRTSSTEVRGEGARRLHLQRSEEDVIQVRYQKLETVTGPRVTLRVWEPRRDVLPLEKIVTDANDLKTFEKWLQAEHGIIVATGSSGSGKTTTFYSLMNSLARQKRVVFTIESPVEIVVEGVNQVELRGNKPEYFEEAFDQIYSSDPDVVCMMLSSHAELEQTLLSSAYRAASTGHLVLLQMDAPSAEVALDHLKKFLPSGFEQLIVGISAQKLIREGKKTKAVYDLTEGRRG